MHIWLAMLPRRSRSQQHRYCWSLGSTYLHVVYLIAFQTVNLFLKIVIFCVISGKQYQCSHCNSTFGAERLLRDHMRYHGKIIYNWKAFISYHIFINRSVGILKCLTWMTGIPSVKPISEFRGALFLWIWKTVSSIKLNVNDFKYFFTTLRNTIYLLCPHQDVSTHKISCPQKIWFHIKKNYLLSIWLVQL